VKRIPLHDRAGVLVAYSLVDDADFADVGLLRWYLGTNGYVERNLPGPQRGTELLHRRLMGLAPGDPREVDHRDRNPLDNRRRNLRIARRPEQTQNVSSYGRSRHRGVWLHKSGRWNAQVQANGHRHHLGLWDSEELAAAAASGARRVLMPFAEEKTA
jgi:hypothetical protein